MGWARYDLPTFQRQVAILFAVLVALCVVLTVATGKLWLPGLPIVAASLLLWVRKRRATRLILEANGRPADSPQGQPAV